MLGIIVFDNSSLKQNYYSLCLRYQNCYKYKYENTVDM